MKNPVSVNMTGHEQRNVLKRYTGWLNPNRPDRLFRSEKLFGFPVEHTCAQVWPDLAPHSVRDSGLFGHITQLPADQRDHHKERKKVQRLSRQPHRLSLFRPVLTTVPHDSGSLPARKGTSLVKKEVRKEVNPTHPARSMRW